MLVCILFCIIVTSFGISSHDVVEAHCYLSISGELIVSRYVAESITMIVIDSATYLLTISSPDQLSNHSIRETKVEVTLVMLVVDYNSKSRTGTYVSLANHGGNI